MAWGPLSGKRAVHQDGTWQEMQISMRVELPLEPWDLKYLFDNLKSKFSGFPAGFEHVGRRIRIPLEKLCI